MKIGSISEDLNLEKRISLTPGLSKQYLDLGVEVFINKSYGIHLSFHDNDYKEKGVQISNDVNEVINNCNVLLQVHLPEINYIEKLRENTSIIGIFNPYGNEEKIDLLLKKRDLNSKLIRRRGRVYIINKKNPKFKARQK